MKKTIAILILLAACGGKKQPESTLPANTGGETYGGEEYGGSPYGGDLYGWSGDDEPQGAAYVPKHYDNPKAECDAYVLKMEKYFKCDKVPPEAVQAAQQGLAAMKTAWADWSTWSPEVQDAAADACHQAVDALTQGAEAMGCMI